jgi:apurinic endonuclease APN1
VRATDADVELFFQQRRQRFKQLFVHASYWINLADSCRLYHPTLIHEIALAKRLSFTHMVLHPGSVRAPNKKIHGIDALVRTLNSVMRAERELIFVLENTAHGNHSVGSDIRDFGLIMQKIEYPERLRFCIDTAHAFAYGYDITSDTGRASFINLLVTTIGIDTIALMHVNDSSTACGSKVDCHALIDQGQIKTVALKQLVLDSRLVHIPLILELPVITEQEEFAMLKQVCAWHQ